jgi:hypothetical protein
MADKEISVKLICSTLKMEAILNGLHGVIYQKLITIITTAVSITA